MLCKVSKNHIVSKSINVKKKREEKQRGRIQNRIQKWKKFLNKKKDVIWKIIEIVLAILGILF